MTDSSALGQAQFQRSSKFYTSDFNQTFRQALDGLRSDYADRLRHYEAAVPRTTSYHLNDEPTFALPSS